MNISTQRIDHIDRVRTAYIMLRDIPLATLSEEYSSINGDSDWVIRPIWENCEKAKNLGLFVDIAGIDLSLHQDEYVRRGVPSFIKQRVILEGRSDLPVLLCSHNTSSGIGSIPETRSFNADMPPALPVDPAVTGSIEIGDVILLIHSVNVYDFVRSPADIVVIHATYSMRSAQNFKQIVLIQADVLEKYR